MDDISRIKILNKEEKLNIRQLNLHGQQLTEFPEEIFDLHNLQYLYLSQNQLNEIPKKLSQLSNLRYLNLSHNYLSKIPESFKGSKLKTLILSNNRFNEFPFVLSSFKSLETLSLSFNDIKELPEKISGFKELENLFLEKIEIKRLPRAFAYFPKLKNLAINGNMLSNVPLEIAIQGVLSLRNYFYSLDASEKTYKVYEAKLLIVGEGNVGKTCLMEKLIDDKKNINELGESTEGIGIKPWFINTTKHRDFRVNIWDFGGQEIYHATHQFVLTKCSLYILVWTARTDDNIISFDYWLNVIKLLSDNAPVIVVLNKIDERIKMIDEESISSKFKNIVYFHKVSALDGTGINELRKIIKKEIEKLSHIGDTLPKEWVDIRTELEKSGKNHINIQEYKTICKKYGLSGKQALLLSHYFHDLGIILHFQDSEILKDIVFLKPEWATNAVYKVTDTKSVQSNYGKFEYSALSEIWSTYTEDKYKYLIELMKKFELCFKVNKDTYIVPELLSERKPKEVYNWDHEDNLNFEFHYDFMPTGIITRLIVKVHDMIFRSNYWKNGLMTRISEKFKDARGRVIEVKNTDALIISYPLERKIRINIVGYEKSKLLHFIRTHIDKIHKSLNHPLYREMIPCKCQVCKNSIEKSLFNFSDLKIFLDNNETSVFCTKGRTRIGVKFLLEGFGQTIRKEHNINQVFIQDVDQVVFSDNFSN